MLAPSAIINEIAWRGAVGEPAAEWVELYVPEPGLLDFSLGWQLAEGSGTTLVTSLTGRVSGPGYYVIERTTPSLPDVVLGQNDNAGPWGGSGLNNDGEHLVLLRPDGSLASEVDARNGWPGGEAGPGETAQWTGREWVVAPGTPGAPNAALGLNEAPVEAEATGDAQSEARTLLREGVWRALEAARLYLEDFRKALMVS